MSMNEQKQEKTGCGETVRGRFLVFEGIDGSGKSTQVRLLAERLRGMGIPCDKTMEPTDGPFGSQIRQVLTGRIQADPRVLAPLFVADRLDHLLKPGNGLSTRVQAGVTVLCDRYYYSNYAYQSADLSMDWVIEANAPCREILRPDLCLFLDVDPDAALERITRNRDHTELFEKKSRLVRTREDYREAFRRIAGEEHIVTIDGSGTKEEIAERIWEAVRQLFAQQEK